MSTDSRRRLTQLAVTATIALTAFGGSAAFAQSTPSSRGYDESLGVLGEIRSEEPGTTQAAPTPASPAEPAGDLPFTGLDLTVLALMGVTLVAVGAGLRRAARTRTRP